MNRRKFLTVAALATASAQAQTVAPWLMRNNPFTCPWPDKLIAWYDAADIALADNDPVSSWTDKSGNGNTLAQGTGSKQPLYKTNIINGLPVVRFDGTDDNLIDTSISGITNTTVNEMCVACVMNVTTPGASSHSVFGLTTAGPGAKELRADNTIPLTYLNGDGGCSATLAIPGCYDRNLFIVFNTTPGSCSPPGPGNQNRAYVNGLDSGQVSLMPTLRPILQICLGASTNTQLFCVCDIAEFILWERDLQPCELDTVFRYLSNKYALSAYPAL